MLRQSITLYNYEKRKAEIISTFINAEIYHDHYKKNHHPFSRLIVEKLPAFYKLHGFILLKTCLRYSDILELDLAAITNEAAFGIIQNKTKRKITRDFKIYDSGLKELLLTYKYLNDSVSYESLRAAIKRITRKYLSFLKMEYNHDTHIFRHLDASFLHSIGKSFHDISIYLGHMDKSIVNLYIHEELSPNSINHN